MLRTSLERIAAESLTPAVSKFVHGDISRLGLVDPQHRVVEGAKSSAEGPESINAATRSGSPSESTWKSFAPLWIRRDSGA